MIGIGYRRAMSATTSQRPVMVTGSTSSVMTSAIVVCSRAVDRGVNAWADQSAQPMVIGAVPA